MAKRIIASTLWRDILFTSLLSVFSGMVTSVVIGLLIFLMLPSAQAAMGEDWSQLEARKPEQATRGSLLLRLASGGVAVDAPLLETNVEMAISGLTARVKVQQGFHNPGQDWVEGVYVFPLPENAAVDRMRLRIGERVIEGEIKERGEAKRNYQKAKREGKRASLLTQERPNIFTTSVANIPPGGRVVVEIEYQQTLQYEAEGFTLRFPLVVAPRYIPGAPVASEKIDHFPGTGWAQDTSQVPDASRITPPVVDPSEGPVNPVTFSIQLDAGMPLAELKSLYHPMDIEILEAGVRRLTLKSSQVPADRDFVLNWIPKADQAPRAALFNQQWQGDQYSLLMVMPPYNGLSQQAPPKREVVFVIDRSGSMHGASIRQARSALKMALQRLKPSDRFNVIAFNHSTDALYTQSRIATEQNLQQAVSFVQGMDADGGTEMLPALQMALAGEASPGMLRQIVFLTDGSVGNERALLSVIHKGLGNSRLFTIGIGSAPNSFFMTRAAQFGRGSFTYIGKLDQVQERMQKLFRKLESPMLTNLQLQWPDGREVEMWPRRIPDLYLGEPVVLAIRSSEKVGSLVLQGEMGGNPWQQKVAMRGGADRSGIHLLWARRKIAALMDGLAQGQDRVQVRQAVLAVALEHRMVSRYTSLVAVEKQPARPPETPLKKKAVPTNLPAGWSAKKVFGTLPKTATASQAQMLGGTILLLLGLLVFRRYVARSGECVGSSSATWPALGAVK